MGLKRNECNVDRSLCGLTRVQESPLRLMLLHWWTVRTESWFVFIIPWSYFGWISIGNNGSWNINSSCSQYADTSLAVAPHLQTNMPKHLTWRQPNGQVRNLDLSKVASEIMVSCLDEHNILDSEPKIHFTRTEMRCIFVSSFKKMILCTALTSTDIFSYGSSSV